MGALSYLQGNGDGTFISRFQRSGCDWFAVGDLDLDGIEDVILGSNLFNEIGTYLGTEQATLQQAWRLEWPMSRSPRHHPRWET